MRMSGNEVIFLKAKGNAQRAPEKAKIVWID